MEKHEAPQVMEAILFVSGEAVTVDDLATALGLSRQDALWAADELERQLDQNRRGITVKRYGDHLRLETRAEFAPYVERLLQPVQRQSLSQTGFGVKNFDCLLNLLCMSRFGDFFL